MQCNKPLIRANLILSDPEEEEEEEEDGETFFRFECGNERALSLLSELSKRLQFYYIDISTCSTCILQLACLARDNI